MKGRGEGVYSPTTKRVGIRRSSRDLDAHRTDAMTDYVDNINKRYKPPQTNVKAQRSKTNRSKHMSIDLSDLETHYCNVCSSFFSNEQETQLHHLHLDCNNATTPEISVSPIKVVVEEVREIDKKEVAVVKEVEKKKEVESVASVTKKVAVVKEVEEVKEEAASVTQEVAVVKEVEEVKENVASVNKEVAAVELEGVEKVKKGEEVALVTQEVAAVERVEEVKEGGEVSSVTQEVAAVEAVEEAKEGEEVSSVTQEVVTVEGVEEVKEEVASDTKEVAVVKEVEEEVNKLDEHEVVDVMMKEVIVEDVMTSVFIKDNDNHIDLSILDECDNDEVNE